MKSLEYRILEFDLITFFKLVNGETTINIQLIFEPYRTICLLRGNFIKFTCKHNFNNEAWHNSFFNDQLKYGTNLRMNQFLAKKFKNFD